MLSNEAVYWLGAIYFFALTVDMFILKNMHLKNLSGPRMWILGTFIALVTGLCWPLGAIAFTGTVVVRLIKETRK